MKNDNNSTHSNNQQINDNRPVYFAKRAVIFEEDGLNSNDYSQEEIKEKSFDTDDCLQENIEEKVYDWSDKKINNDTDLSYLETQTNETKFYNEVKKTYPHQIGINPAVISYKETKELFPDLIEEYDSLYEKVEENDDLQDNYKIPIARYKKIGEGADLFYNKNISYISSPNSENQQYGNSSFINNSQNNKAKEVSEKTISDNFINKPRIKTQIIKKTTNDDDYCTVFE